MNPNNQKYEITDIAHPEYPFLHRIRVLRDIGPTVKAGDLGGFVEGECNLSYEDRDSWIAHDAIAANGAFVTDGTLMRDQAVICGEAHAHRAVLSDHARVEVFWVWPAGAEAEAQARGGGTVSNFFEQELRRLFEDGEIIQEPKFVGRTCLGDLGGGLWVRAEFVTAGVAGKYEALRLIVLKRTEGEVDRLILPFWDMFATQAPHTQLSGKPYIFTCHRVSKWYNSQPTADDYQALRQAAGDYLNVFRERGQERERPAPVRKSPGHSASNKGGTVMDQNDILQARLDQNYRDYVAQLQGKTADELIALAPEIVAAQQLRDELACACSEEDAAALLQFDDPLEEMRGFWATEQDGCHSEEIGHMIGELQCRGEFPAPPPIKAVQKETKTAPHRPKRDQER